MCTAMVGRRPRSRNGHDRTRRRPERGWADRGEGNEVRAEAEDRPRPVYRRATAGAPPSGQRAVQVTGNRASDLSLRVLDRTRLLTTDTTRHRDQPIPAH